MGSDNLYVLNPPKRNRCIIQITKAISVLEAVLSQNNVFTLAKYSDKNAPAPDRNINYSSISAGLSYTGIRPHTADQIAGLARFQLINQRNFAHQG
jgi:hypothetical protein